jgi:hypothetical protein
MIEPLRAARARRLGRFVSQVEKSSEPFAADHKKENPWTQPIGGGGCCVVV